MKTTRRGSGSGRRASRRASSSTIDVPDALSSAPLWMSDERNASEPERMPAAAEVVVVAAHDDGLVGQRPGAFEDADHVLGRDRLAFDLDPGVSVQPASSTERGLRSASIC